MNSNDLQEYGQSLLREYANWLSRQGSARSLQYFSYEEMVPELRDLTEAATYLEELAGQMENLDTELRRTWPGQPLEPEIHPEDKQPPGSGPERTSPGSMPTGKRPADSRRLTPVSPNQHHRSENTPASGNMGDKETSGREYQPQVLPKDDNLIPDPDRADPDPLTQDHSGLVRQPPSVRNWGDLIEALEDPGALNVTDPAGTAPRDVIDRDSISFQEFPSGGSGGVEGRPAVPAGVRSSGPDGPGGWSSSSDKAPSVPDYPGGHAGQGLAPPVRDLRAFSQRISRTEEEGPWLSEKKDQESGARELSQEPLSPELSWETDLPSLTNLSPDIDEILDALTERIDKEFKRFYGP